MTKQRDRGEHSVLHNLNALKEPARLKISFQAGRINIPDYKFD